MRSGKLAHETRTMVFYEAPHRIVDALADFRTAFGGDREAVIARELTKRFESVIGGAARRLAGSGSRRPYSRQGRIRGGGARERNLDGR